MDWEGFFLNFKTKPYIIRELLVYIYIPSFPHEMSKTIATQRPVGHRRTQFRRLASRDATRDFIDRSSAPGGIEMSSGYLNDHLEGLYIYIYIGL